MKITQDVRDYAEEHGIDAMKAIEEGMYEQAANFNEKGGKIYHKA